MKEWYFIDIAIWQISVCIFKIPDYDLDLMTFF